MSPPIHIVAMAARTPVGKRAETCAAAVRAGISRVQEHPFMVDAAGDPLLCGFDADIPPPLLGTARMTALLSAALDELAAKIPTALQSCSEVPCWLALPEPRPGCVERDLQDVAPKVQAQLVAAAVPPLQRLSWHTATQGHAGAVVGINAAIEALISGRSDLCIVGGVDSYFDADTLDWLEQDRRLMRDGIRGAFPPGEGAALVALATDTTRRRFGLASQGIILGSSYCYEPGDENSDEGLLGLGLTEAYTRLSRHLPPGNRFDDIFIDINDERSRTTDYAFATLRCGALFRDGSQYTTCVGSTGEVGACSAPLNWILAASSHLRGYARGSHTLVSSASWNGLRGAVLMCPGKG